jgi:tRNA threonylcarbamoyladenosine dehydratase
MINDSSQYSTLLSDRTQRLVGAATVRSLRNCCFAVAGCGGVGGAAAILLARMGVGRFVLSDPGRFDPPDANRQWAADSASMGDNKCERYAQILAQINPNIHVSVMPEGVDAGNADSLASQADVLLDCLDVSVGVNIRAALYGHCRRRGVYCLSAPVLGFGTLLAASDPNGMPMDSFVEVLKSVGRCGKLPVALHEIFAPLSMTAIERDLPTGRIPSLAIGPALGAAFASTEALIALSGRESPLWRQPLCLPRVLAVDALSMRYEFLEIGQLLAATKMEAAA